MSNESKSGMQVLGTKISSMQIKNDFVCIPEECERSLEVSYNPGKIAWEEEREYFSTLAKLEITFDNKLEDKHFSMKMELEGCFIYTGKDKEEFESLANLNGAAILYSIARGQVICMSSQCLNGSSVVLPVLNFAEKHTPN